MQMPVMNGMEFLEKASHEFRDTCFIVISGYDYFDYAKAALKCGAIDYLLKPIAREELNAAIDKAVQTLGNTGTCLEKKRQSFPLMKLLPGSGRTLTRTIHSPLRSAVMRRSTSLPRSISHAFFASIMR